MDSRNLCTYGYKSMLECVTRATLLEQPNDNLEFVIQYFSEMKDFRESQQETDPKIVSFMYQEEREKKFFRNRITPTTTNEVTASSSSDVSSQTDVGGAESNRKETEKLSERQIEVPASSLDVKVESKLAQSPCDVSVKTSHVYSVSDPKEQERKETTEISVNFQISVAVKSSKPDDAIASGSGMTSTSSNLPVTVAEVTHRVTTLPTSSKNIQGGQPSLVEVKTQPVKQKEESQVNVKIQRDSSSTERTITSETEIIRTETPETEQVPAIPGESMSLEDITSSGSSVTRASLKFSVSVPETTDKSLLPPPLQKEKQDYQKAVGRDTPTPVVYREESSMLSQVAGKETTKLQSAQYQSKPLAEIIMDQGAGTSSESRTALRTAIKSPEPERKKTQLEPTSPPFEPQTRPTPSDMFSSPQTVREPSQPDVVTTSGLSLTSQQPADRLVLSPPPPKEDSPRTRDIFKRPKCKTPQPQIRSPPLESRIRSPPQEPATSATGPETDTIPLQPRVMESPKLEDVTEFSAPSVSSKPSDRVLSPSSSQEPKGTKASVGQKRFFPSKFRDLLPGKLKASDSEKTKTSEREFSTAPLEPIMSPPLLEQDTRPIPREPETMPTPADTETRMIQLDQSQVPLTVIEEAPMVTVPEVTIAEASDTKRTIMPELDTRLTQVDQFSVPPFVMDSSELEVSSPRLPYVDVSPKQTTQPMQPGIKSPFEPDTKPTSPDRLQLPSTQMELSRPSLKEKQDDVSLGQEMALSPIPRETSPAIVKPFISERTRTLQSDIQPPSYEPEIRPISLEQYPGSPIVGQDTPPPTRFRRDSPTMAEASGHEGMTTLQETRIISLEDQLSVPTIVVDTSRLEEIAALESKLPSPSLTAPYVIVPVVRDNTGLPISPAREIYDTQIPEGQDDIVPFVSEPSVLESTKSPEPGMTSALAVSETWQTPLDLFPGPPILVDSSKLEEDRASESPVPSAYLEPRATLPEVTDIREIKDDLLSTERITTPKLELRPTPTEQSTALPTQMEYFKMEEDTAPEFSVTRESTQFPILTVPEMRDDLRDLTPSSPSMEKQDDEIFVSQYMAVPTTPTSRETSPVTRITTPETMMKPMPVDQGIVQPMVSGSLDIPSAIVPEETERFVLSVTPVEGRQVDRVAVDEDMTLYPTPRGGSPRTVEVPGAESTETTETQITQIQLDQFSLPSVPVESVGLEEDTTTEPTVTDKSLFVPGVTVSEFADSLPPTLPKETKDDEESGRQDNLVSFKLGEEQPVVIQASETETKPVVLDSESGVAPLEPETRPAPLPSEKTKTMPTGPKAQKAPASAPEKAAKPGTKSRQTLKKAKTTVIQTSEKTKTPGPASKSVQMAQKPKTKPSAPVPPTTTEPSKLEQGTALESTVVVPEVTESQVGIVITEQDKPATTKMSQESPVACETERTELLVPEIRPLESEKTPSPPEKTKGRLIDTKPRGSPKVRLASAAAASSAPEKTTQIALKKEKKVRITAATAPEPKIVKTTGMETRQDLEAKETDTSGIESGKIETTPSHDIKVEGKPTTGPSMKTRRVTTLRDPKKQDGKGITDNGKTPKTHQMPPISTTSKTSAFPSDAVPEVTPRLVLPPIPSRELLAHIGRDKMPATKFREDTVAGELESLTRGVPLDECLGPPFPFSNIEDMTQLVSAGTSLIPPGAAPDLAYNLILPPIKSKEYQFGRMTFGQDKAPTKQGEGSGMVKEAVPDKTRARPPGFRPLGPLKVRPLQSSDLQKTKTLGSMIWSRPVEPKSPWDHCNRLPEVKRVLWTDRERVNPVVPRMRRGIQQMHSCTPEPTSEIVEINISSSI